MKAKWYFGMMAMLVAVMFFACSDDNDDNGGNGKRPENAEEQFKQDFFSIDVEQAVFKEGTVPAGTVELLDADNIECNTQALTGGANFVTIYSDVELSKFYISIPGTDGYWEVPATPSAKSAAFSYDIPIAYGEELGADMTMRIVAEDMQGQVSAPVDLKIDYVEAKTGELNINLTFSQPKDVDLILVLPNQRVIYYGQRGGITYNYTQQINENK